MKLLANRHEVRDDSLITSNYSEQSKNKSSLVGKIKGKFSSKSDSEPLASKSAQWYGDPEQAKESLSDKGMLKITLLSSVADFTRINHISSYDKYRVLT